MKIRKGFFGGVVIRFEKSEKVLLKRYIKEVDVLGVYSIPQLLGSFLYKQIDFVLETLAAAGILTNLIPDSFFDDKGKV
ncbi:MAG: hypothetical protein KAJ07_09110 [Planctomycetes bacterium]|nr:hypothetical protein [Planctomycetota bacterium]